jgi:alkaline phosphatase D
MKKLLLERRTVLAGLAGALGVGCTSLTAGKLFPLGVAAGDATSDGALLWTHYTGFDALEVVAWLETGSGEVMRRLPVETQEGYAVVEVSELEPGTWYLYRFETSTGETSTIGRFRTATAADSLEIVTLGATSCIKEGHSYAALGHAAGRTDLDAFIFLGDSVYTDGSSSLSDFRRKWADGLRGPEYVALRGSTSLITQWDDHEVRNNWEGDDVKPELIANARRAFLEHQPLRQNPERPHRFWRSLKWGRTAELFILDARSERNRLKNHYLSPEQLDWLIEGVSQSPARFKLILNTVPIGAFDSAFFAPFNSDNWQGFPEQREALLRGIEATGTDGVMFVSGDFHFACFGRVAKKGPGSKVFEALVGPGANKPNPLPAYPKGDPWEFSSAVNNYTTLQLDPASGEARVRYHAGDGRTLFDRVIS